MFPAGSAGGVHVLRRPGPDVRDPRARGEHLVPGLPPAGRGARPRPLLPPPVREPRRPARLLERDRRARRRRRAAHLGLPRRRALADPPVRDRRLHRLHALAGRMVRYWQRRRSPAGAARASSTALGAVATGVVPCSSSRRSSPGRMDGHHRDPGARRALPRRQPPLPDRRAAAASGRRPMRRPARAAQHEVVVFVEGLDPAATQAAWYAREVGAARYQAVHVRGLGTPIRGGGDSPARRCTSSRTEAGRWTRSSTTSGASPAATGAS